MLIEHLSRQLLERQAQGLHRRRRVAHTPCAPRQRVSAAGEAPRDMLAFCSNDYLGLANHPAVVEALCEGARLHGAGSGASHLISGHSQAHEALEQELAAFLEPCVPGARALYFGTGYLANLALLSTLGDAGATIFSDKLNHASIIDGARLARAHTLRYAHGRLDVLDARLAECATPVKLIVTDAVFSMDGDRADLPALLALAQRHDAWIVVDDAHGFGVFGDGGRGTLSHFGLRSERFVYMGTLGKAAGLGGAFVAAHPAVIETLLQAGRSYVYTTAASPALAHALRASLRLIAGDEGERRRRRLHRRVHELRTGMAGLIRDADEPGWSLAESASAIQPLIVGANDAALALARALDAQGLWVPAIRPPTVPPGTARLRVTLSADHAAEDVQRLLAALAQATRREAVR